MKCAIYIRTSTVKQEPQNQQMACEEFARVRGYEIEGIYLEKISGWKQIHRLQYEIIKEKARCGKISAVVVWRLDRWIRNRDTLLEDVTTLKNYGCKIHSVQEAWLEAINIEGALGQTIRDFLLGLIGSLAEMESQVKSERVKLAIREENGVKMSYRGKKWGRRQLSEEVAQEVIELRKKGATYDNISKVIFYWDKNGNKKFLSKGAIYNIILNQEG